MEKLIKKTAELIKLSDIFDSYKLELIKIVGNKSEYDEYPDIFKKESISDFTLKDLFEFLETNLKNNNYSIIKRDITKYNLFVEILNNFNKFTNQYTNNVDIKIDDADCEF